MSSLRGGHANLLCIFPIFSDASLDAQRFRRCCQRAEVHGVWRRAEWVEGAERQRQGVSMKTHETGQKLGGGVRVAGVLVAEVRLDEAQASCVAAALFNILQHDFGSDSSPEVPEPPRPLHPFAWSPAQPARALFHNHM